MEAVILQQDLHNVLPDVVDVPLHRGNDNGQVAALGVSLALEVGFNHLEGRLGCLGAHQQLGEKERLFLKALSHGVQGGDDFLVD